MNPNSGQEVFILADAHVHLYQRLDMEELLDGWLKNFKGVAARQRMGSTWVALLFLADTKEDNGFYFFKQKINDHKKVLSSDMGKWHFYPTLEDGSLYGRWNEGEGLYIIAGRQIKTTENLEVLALGTEAFFKEEQPIEELIQRIGESGALPVIPWGVGKWLGARGGTVKKLIQDKEIPYFFLGDNGNRPLFWPKSSIFRQASRRGIKILPGSDPLPLPGNIKVPGEYGFWLRGNMDPDYPLRSIKKLLLDPEIYPVPYGRRERPLRFFWNQFRLRTMNR